MSITSLNETQKAELNKYLAKFRACRNERFCIGDLLIRMREQEKLWNTPLFLAFQQKSGLSPFACRQYAWVASLYAEEDRSLPHLSWSHYRGGGQISDESERLRILRQASAEKWTFRRLKAYVAENKLSIKTRTGSICDAPDCQGNQCTLTLEGLNTSDPDGTFRERLHFCNKQCLQQFLQTLP